LRADDAIAAALQHLSPATTELGASFGSEVSLKDFRKDIIIEF